MEPEKAPHRHDALIGVAKVKRTCPAPAGTDLTGLQDLSGLCVTVPTRQCPGGQIPALDQKTLTAAADPLWDSRYKSSLVQEEHYLLLCQRYIELNPVRVGMLDDPSNYRWSSYRSNGLGQSDTLITPHIAYSGLDTNVAPRLTTYRALFRHELDDAGIADIRLTLNQASPLAMGIFVGCTAGAIRCARRTLALMN